jgi:hypothetical protein
MKSKVAGVPPVEAKAPNESDDWFKAIFGQFSFFERCGSRCAELKSHTLQRFIRLWTKQST